jgi:transcriptional repressor NrdR
MKCPYCQVDNDRVLDSRASEDGFVTRRRRECLACGQRYTTYERVEPTIKVIKKDGTRVPFDREKIKVGLEKACWKRPISDAQLEAIVTEVENNVQANFHTEVESRYLGELVMDLLRKLDQVAYVRFASVYRQFEDVHDFVDELRPMLAESPPPTGRNASPPAARPTAAEPPRNAPGARGPGGPDPPAPP